MGKQEKNSVLFLNGCQSCEPSGYLANIVVNFLKTNGHEMAKSASRCDTVIINTCGVTNSKISESETLLKRALGYRKPDRVILFGCYADMIDRSKLPSKVICIGSKDLDKFNDHFFHRLPIGKVPKSPVSPDIFMPYQERMTNRDCFVMICQGCLNCCSYCNIKRAKGSPTSKPEKEIIAEIRQGLKAGKREFVLLADDCGSYGADLGTDIVKLSKKVLSLDDSVRIKLSTLFPGQLIRYYKGLRPLLATKRISYVNLPLQSGAPRVLKLMNRGYDLDKIREIIGEIRSLSPETWLYTHIMINFPTETWDDFIKSTKIAELFDEVLFITYSDNEFTKASGIGPKVGQKEQKRRISHVRKILREKKCRGVMAVKQDESYV